MLFREGPVHAQMPFADGGVAEALLFREGADGHAIRRDARRFEYSENAVLKS